MTTDEYAKIIITQVEYVGSNKYRVDVNLGSNSVNRITSNFIKIMLPEEDPNKAYWVWGDSSQTTFESYFIWGEREYVPSAKNYSFSQLLSLSPSGSHIYSSGNIYAIFHDLSAAASCGWKWWRRTRNTNQPGVYDISGPFDFFWPTVYTPIDLRFYSSSICGGKVRITDEKVTKVYTTISLVNSNRSNSIIRFECIKDTNYKSMTVSFDNGDSRTANYSDTNMIITYDMPSNTTKGSHDVTIILTKTDNTTETYTQQIYTYPLLIKFDPSMDLDNIYPGDTIKYIITDTTDISSVTWMDGNYEDGSGFSYDYRTINSTLPNPNYTPGVRAIITFTNGFSIEQYVLSFNLKPLDIPLIIDATSLGPKRFFVNGESITYSVTEPSLISSCEWKWGITSLGTGNTYIDVVDFDENLCTFSSIERIHNISAKMKFNAYEYPMRQEAEPVYQALKRDIISYDGSLITNRLIPFKTSVVDFLDTFPTWDFGDGSDPATGSSNTLHMFSSSGEFTVSLTYVVDGVERTHQQNIHVWKNYNDEILDVDFVADKTSGLSPLTVVFKPLDLYRCPNVSSSWDFGDGTTSTELNPVHTYTHDTNPATYTVIHGISYGTKSKTKTKYNYITVNPGSIPPASSDATVKIDVQNLTACDIYINGVKQTGFNPLTIKLTPDILYTIDARKSGYFSNPISRTFYEREEATIYIILTLIVVPPPPEIPHIKWEPNQTDLTTNGRTIILSIDGSVSGVTWDVGEGGSTIPGNTISYIYSKYGTYFVTCYYKDE